MPPRWLVPVLLVLTSLALGAIWISAAPRWLLILPLIPLAPMLLRPHRAPRGMLRFRDDGEVVWIDLHHREHALQLLGVGSRGPLHVLRFSADAGGLSAIYCRPGNLDAAQARRLNLWLRRHSSGARGVADTVAAP